MSQKPQSATAADVSIYHLRPAPPVRALGIAAVAAVVGAIVLVSALQMAWPTAVAAVGGILVALGVVLLVLALVAMFRMRVRAELTPTGYSFRTPAGVRHGTWAETVKVTVSDTGHRVTFVHRDDTTDHVITPLGNQDPQQDELLADVYRRLERSRKG
ncbi:hypothetical protein GCM10027418_31350 [Mariniluteicoccus endophyticus]